MTRTAASTMAMAAASNILPFRKARIQAAVRTGLLLPAPLDPLHPSGHIPFKEALRRPCCYGMHPESAVLVRCNGDRARGERNRVGQKRYAHLGLELRVELHDPRVNGHLRVQGAVYEAQVGQAYRPEEPRQVGDEPAEPREGHGKINPAEQYVVCKTGDDE